MCAEIFRSLFLPTRAVASADPQHAGADPNLPDSSGMPPLLRASQRGDCASIRVLHGRGANVHARSGLFGRSALALAAERGHPETCKLLLELGADASARDMGGRTPVQMARESNM